MQELKIIKSLNLSYKRLGLSYGKFFIAFIMMIVTSILEMTGLLLLYPLILLLSDQSQPLQNHTLFKHILPSSLDFVHSVLLMFAIVGVMYVLKNLILYFTYQNNVSFSVYYYRNLIRALYRAYIAKSLLDFKKESLGSFSNVIGVQAEKLIHGVIRPLLVVATEFFILLGIIVLVLFLISPWIIITVTAVCIFAFGVYYLILRNKALSWGRREMHSKTDLLRLINGTALGISEIKIFGKEDYLTEKVWQCALEETKMFHCLEMYQQAPRYLLETVFIVTFLMCFSFAILAGFNASILLAKFSVVAAASFRLLPSINRLIGSYANFSYHVSPAQTLLDEILNSHLGNLDSNKIISEAKNHDFTVNKVELIDIRFRYPDTKKLVLNSLSLIVNKGEHIGFMGHTGSGKSTLIKIIAGLYKADSGQILVDGHSIDGLIRCWQKCIGYVPQESFILAGSIKENITFGDALIDGQAVLDALDAVGMKDFVLSLPEGIDARIGETGIGLSGGQKQLVCLARALARKPKILLLDEPTASLDEYNESIVLNAIELLTETTIVMASHKINNFDNFDKLYLFCDGNIEIKNEQ